MKKSATLLFTLTLFMQGFSQQGETPDMPEMKQKRHELGVNMYALQVDPGFGYSYAPIKYVSQYALPGLYFRYGKAKNRFRVSLFYLHNSNSNHFGAIDESYFSYSYQISRGGELKVGYQRLLGGKMLTPYLSIDAGYTYMREKGFAASVGAGINSMGPSSFFVEKSGVKVNPGAGIRWQLKNGLVFSLETGLDLFFMTESDFRKDYSHSGSGISYKPVQQLSLGFMF